MAAITPVVTGTGVVTHGAGWRRTATAQATTGQTDWFDVPDWAQFATVFLNLTANAGTNPTTVPSFLAASPVTRDDTHVLNVGEHAAFTAITGAAQYTFDLGPGVSGIANDVTIAAAADSYAALNVVLPELLGVKILNTRTNGNETYTYDLSVKFRGRR